MAQAKSFAEILESARIISQKISDAAARIEQVWLVCIKCDGTGEIGVGGGVIFCQFVNVRTQHPCSNFARRFSDHFVGNCESRGNVATAGELFRGANLLFEQAGQARLRTNYNSPLSLKEL